jgi:tripartite-type tricarboxylate transporter receptor subunit TctC
MVKFRFAFLFFAAALAFGASGADEYPTRPVRLIVPFGPGSGPDINARLLARALEQRVGQAVAVENRPGAGSLIGTNAVAKAAPDGYTILYGTNSGTSAARAQFKSVPYDPVNDLTGIAMSHESSLVLVVRPEEKGLTLAQFVEKMRKDPGKYPIGGTSTTGQLLSALLANNGKTGHSYVPYQNTGLQMNDLMGGRLGGTMSAIPGIPALAQAGKVHVLAVSGNSRVAAFPSTPTMTETYPGMVVTSWSGYFAPAKTPRPIVALLNRHMTEAFKEPAIDKSINDAGAPFRLKVEEIDAFVKKDEARWTELYRLARIDPE